MNLKSFIPKKTTDHIQSPEFWHQPPNPMNVKTKVLPALDPNTAKIVGIAITERVAKRIQELNGLYGSPASFNLKDAVYVEVLSVLKEGVEV